MKVNSMKSVLFIDWLSLYCFAPLGHFGGAVSDFCKYHWEYKKRDYGTQMYKEFYDVFLSGKRIANVQCEPRNGLLHSNSVLIKFSNRLLYQRDCWDVVNAFLDNHLLTVNNITRLDLCCDFNRFVYGEPSQLILDFLNSYLRHKGRGAGVAYFVHYNKASVTGGGTKQHLAYNGLSFGSHSSDVRVYLYNKTLELATVKDKPYIRDGWNSAGLDINQPVWRLEVSLKDDGMKIVDKDSGKRIPIGIKEIQDFDYIHTLYMSYVRKYFSFVLNDHAIKNITREPLITLFENSAARNIALLREVGCSNQSDKVFIKTLQQAVNKYPYAALDPEVMKALSDEVAKSVDLSKWRISRLQQWQEPFKREKCITKS